MQQPIVADQTVDDGIGLHDQKRCGNHRQHHRRQDRAHPCRRDERILVAQGQQHKTEFTRLCQINGGAQTHAGRCALHARQHKHQACFEQHRHDGEQQHPVPAVKQHFPIELHADGDEKQTQQHIVERANVVFHFVFEIGLGNQHAR